MDNCLFTSHLGYEASENRRVNVSSLTVAAKPTDFEKVEDRLFS